MTAMFKKINISEKFYVLRCFQAYGLTYISYFVLGSLRMEIRVRPQNTKYSIFFLSFNTCIIYNSTQIGFSVLFIIFKKNFFELPLN